MTCCPLLTNRRRPAAVLALAATLVASAGIRAFSAADAASDVALKAAFLYNFVKFTEWPALAAGAAIAVCIDSDEQVAAALTDTVRGQNINGHTLEIRRTHDTAAWPSCHVLFIADGDARRVAGGLSGIQAVPVLTVSDRKDFAQTGGMIEFFVERGRMRFAINVDTAEHSGLRLSSRLLGLAQVVRNHVP
jgi:hypothetical protein